MVKIICAGYPKTGTKSLHAALDMLGYDTIYDYLEHLDYFMDDYLMVLNGEKPMRHVVDKYAEQGVECVIDMPPSFLFEQFYNRWPDAKIILTVRDEDAWYKSIKKMNDTLEHSSYWMTYLSKIAAKYYTFSRTLYQSMLGSGSENEWLWKLHYRRHNAYVRSYIPEKNLLIFQVSDGWEPLCKFLGKEEPDEPFPMVNVAGTKGNILEKILNESMIASTARKEIAFNITVGAAAIGITCAAFYYHRYSQ